ncbi:MAG: hypothetical protein ACTS27_07405 [Phycisphaerales bacterium]
MLEQSDPAYAFEYRSLWHPEQSPWIVNLGHAWLQDASHSSATRWLHDIFPHNYLSIEYLDAPVGHTGQTLREWIEADPPQRGVLSPYTDTLLDWQPPVQNIPMIREHLYKMGRIFSNLFVLEKTSWAKAMADRFDPNPLYRPDPYAPWEAPKGVPIPARFLADTYRGMDPSITIPLPPDTL